MMQTFASIRLHDTQSAEKLSLDAHAIQNITPCSLYTNNAPATTHGVEELQCSS
jgi:hypothetical protein